MSSSLYEIVELANGDVVLQRADENGEPLVSIRFSADSLSYMREGKLDVAKAMIEAGMEAASEIAEDGVEDFLGEFADTEEKPVYH
ncbi:MULTISPECIES: hypothetical protein [unclassified Marinimicrobium]|jgi:hypothetical protein|uniref:hypothetical protein n=1 Tax=Marinimicrobium TaxID=359337 RepID=UPI000467AC69|nr:MULTISPECIES: hypothetical protein [unclassified Marinimicrobium]UZJ45589.1 hypothetical protein OOT55_05905 [Marinimicrobium sp. C6131]